ncbi:MAG: hypothetical protein RQ745_07965, partial [Longimicrobiales bacterium]|nr:hypothetical protein [Longimicrobiales bacterium]
DVRAIARAAFDRAVWAEQGNTWTVGSHSVTGWIRVYPQMADLIDALDRAGFVVWIVSASPQFVVDEIAEDAVGVPAGFTIPGMDRARWAVRPRIFGRRGSSSPADVRLTPTSNTHAITSTTGKPSRRRRVTRRGAHSGNWSASKIAPDNSITVTPTTT